jgi:polyisoprenyl-teichoic acid--peptidoglycan teichoic acid transferase
MAGVSKKRKRRPRSKRSRWNRARYRRRRFYAALVLACLFFGVGTQAAAYFEPEGDQAGGPAEGVATVKTSERLAASRDKKQPPETGDGAARKAAREDRQEAARREARQEAARAAKREAAKEAAKQEAARREAIKDAEEASGDPLDVLVLGVDRRPDAGEDSSTRSDTMMLVRVVPASGEVKLLSVPRDLYVEIESGKKDRINSAFAYGGVDQARSVMEDLTDVEIDNYVIVDFEGFEKVIDAIGGVRVDVGSGVFPAKWNMGEGMEHLNGYKALKYARYRGTPRADLDRIDHQQKLLAALRRQALRWNTVTKLPGAIKVANENVETDLGVMQVIPLARALVFNGKDTRMETAELEGYPIHLSDDAQVLKPDDEANEAIMQDFRD